MGSRVDSEPAKWGTTQAIYDGGDGWSVLRFAQPGLQVAVRLTRVDGLPEIAALRVEPMTDISRLGDASEITFAYPPCGHQEVPISKALLKALPLREIREAALHHQRLPNSVTPDPVLSPLPRGPQPVAEERLRIAAAAYRAAVDGGRPPIPSIQTALGIHRSTALKYVRLARDHHLLGWSTRAGKPGYRAARSPWLPRGRP